MTEAAVRWVPWVSWLKSRSPYIWGAWFYGGFWGIVGAYIGFLNVYFVRAGFSEVAVGILSSVPPLLMLLVAPPVAAWADRRAMRIPLVFWSLVLMGSALLWMFWVKGSVGLLLGFVGLSLGYALVLPLGDGLIARMAVNHRLEYGRMRSWGSLTFAMCAAGFGWLWGQIGYEAMFWVAGLLMLLLAPSVWVLEEIPAPTAAKRFSPVEILRDKGLLAVMLISLFFGLGLGFTDPFLGVSLERLGGTPFMIGLLFLCIALPELPTMQYEQTLARRLGNAAALAVGCVFFIAGYALFALAHQPLHMLLAAPLLGVGYGLLFVGTVRLVDAKVEAERISTVQSLRHALSFGITPLFAGPVGGAVYSQVGQGFYWLTAACLLAALLVAWFNRQRLDVAA